MSDEQDKSVDNQADGDGDGPLGGERLAKARREQQISVLEVAKELHLDEPKVRALERNEFDVLGAPVFAKGHLRKYAQLVGVAEDDVLADYYAMTRTISIPPLVVGRNKIRQEVSPGPWIAVIVVILMAAAGYWWFAIRESAPAPVQSPSEPLQQEQELPEQQAATPQQEEATAEPDVIDDAVVLAAAPLVDEAPAVAEEQPLPEGEVSLSIRFSGDCWTEISDADGSRLFYSMGRSGQTAELSGKAPLSALFGNADNVSVRVNGGEYSLPTPNSANRTVSVAIPSP